MKRYAAIRLHDAIGPIVPGNVMSSGYVAPDGYAITRDGDTVTIDHERAPAPIEVPWSRVVSATCMPEDEEPVADGASVALRKGGWPKGKPRKPAEAREEEGGDA